MLGIAPGAFFVPSTCCHAELWGLGRESKCLAGANCQATLSAGSASRPLENLSPAGEAGDRPRAALHPAPAPNTHREAPGPPHPAAAFAPIRLHGGGGFCTSHQNLLLRAACAGFSSWLQNAHAHGRSESATHHAPSLGKPSLFCCYFIFSASMRYLSPFFAEN